MTDAAQAAQDVLPLGFDTLYRNISADGKSELICYSDVDLAGGLVPGTRATVVLADRITINGLFARPGLDLTLLAREIICDTKATIDVSGGPPDTDFTNATAKNGQNPGENGAAGRSGSPGKRGGNIRIFAGSVIGKLLINANGGAGGGAESGGTGAQGTTGSNWTTKSVAGNGGPGGAAGPAGTPGTGGDGGTVLVKTLDASFSVATATVTRGNPGAPGSNGGPGLRGTHGQGGSGVAQVPCVGSGGPHSHVGVGPCFKNISGGPGQDGPPGSSITTPPPVAVAGADGSFTSKAGFYNSFAEVLSPNYTAIILHQTESFYIDSDISSTAPRLLWLKGLLEARIESDAQMSATELKKYEGQRYRVNALLNQISLSLDYYGQFNNSVPLLTVETIIQELDELFRYGSAVEGAYITFTKANAKNTIDQDSLNTARAKLLQQNDNLKASLADNIKQRNDLEKNVAALNQQLQSLWAQMAHAQQEFQDAVARQSGGCDFGQVISVGAMVATLVTTGGAGYAAVGPALLALKGQQEKNGQQVPVPDTLEGFGYKVNTIVTLGKDVNSFAQALGKVGSSIGKPPGPGQLPPPPDDESKILAQVKQIDDELDKYRNLPEAQAYRALIDNYVATAQAKNNMILQVNALYTAWDNTSSQITQNTLDAAGLQDNIADLSDPRLSVATLFLESAYRQAITGIMYALYSVNRAYTYYTLDTSSIAINDTNMTTLGNAKAVLVQRYYNALAGYGAAPTPFTVNINLLRYLPTGALQSFAAGITSLSFSIPPDAPELKALSQAMVNKIGVAFATQSGALSNFSLNLTHHGHAVMLDADGGKHVFIHAPIHVPFGVDEQGKVTITGDFSGQFTAPPAASGGGHLYNGVSPFGPWTIDINTMDARQRSAITSVTVRLSGYGRGRNPT
jgi:hypothetical protein